MADQPQARPNLRFSSATPIDQLWNFQNRMLSVYRDFAIHWMERRHQSVESALETTREIMACNGESPKIMDLYGRMVTENLERMMDDIGEYAKCQGECASLLQENYVRAENQISEGIIKPIREEAGQAWQSMKEQAKEMNPGRRESAPRRDSASETGQPSKEEARRAPQENEFSGPRPQKENLGKKEHS